MSKTVQEVQALKDGLQAWLERNELFRTCLLQSSKDFYADPHKDYGAPCHLVLRMSNGLYDVMWCVSPEHPDAARFSRLRNEFSDLVLAMGFCFDFEDAGLVGPGDAMLLKEYYDD